MITFNKQQSAEFILLIFFVWPVFICLTPNNMLNPKCVTCSKVIKSNIRYRYSFEDGVIKIGSSVFLPEPFPDINKEFICQTCYDHYKVRS
jgi:hypothetical protein